MSEPADYLDKLPREMRYKAHALMTYMLGEGLFLGDPDKTITGMAERICAAGVPLDRTTSIVRLLHAEATASVRKWERKTGASSHTYPFQTNSDSPQFEKSPAAVVQETKKWLEIWIPETPDARFELVAGLRADGITHYVMAPVFMPSNLFAIFSFATCDPKGFSAQHLTFLRGVFPAMAAALEILAVNRALSEVTRIYVGEEPRKRILAGDVHRGEVMRIRSAVLFADMRRFTELTAAMSAQEATDLLNRYYDCIVPSIEAAGGEVLKFIGDGILAIFRDDDDAPNTCLRALGAAQAGLGAVNADIGAPKFDVGVALHFGEVAFGNVGSGMRLDYTVIGRDVNLAARVAGLCGELNAPLLISDTLRDYLGETEVSHVGAFELKGLDRPVNVFSVPLVATNPAV